MFGASYTRVEVGVARERDRIPAAMWLGFFVAAVLAHGVMIAPSSAALTRAMRSSADDEPSAKITEFDLVEVPEDELSESDEDFIDQDQANRRRPEHTTRLAEVDSSVERETKAPNRPDNPGGQPSVEGRPGSQPVEVGDPDAAASAEGEGTHSAETPADAEADGEDAHADHPLAESADGSEAVLGGGDQARRGQPGEPNLAGSPGTLRQAFGPPGTLDPLVDVDEGTENILDSKRHRFASFFNRIRDRVGDEWRPQKAHSAADPQGSRFGDKRRTTVLMVRLDETGELQKVIVERSSGASHLDDEAVRAMKLAAPFPNPPQGLAEHGHIDFRFGFILDFDGSFRIFRYKK